MKVDKVVSDSGKLTHSGYLEEPTMLWDPSPLLRSLWSQFRYKQWDFYAIYSQELTLCIAVADLAYAKNVFITVYEAGSEPYTYDQVILPWETVKMSNTSTYGTTFYNSSSFFVLFHNSHDHLKSIVGSHKDIDINLIFRKPIDQEGMVYLGPLNSDKSQFFYSHKQYNYLVDGYVKIGKNQRIFHQELGMMDWGRGVWPYHGAWVWGSAMGRVGEDSISLNIGELLKDLGSVEATDDCVVFNKKMIKLGVVNMQQSKNNEHEWEFFTVNQNPDARFASVKGKFTAKKIFRKNINLWLIKSELNQYFGEYEGEVIGIQDRFKFKLNGILEVHGSRW